MNRISVPDHDCLLLGGGLLPTSPHPSAFQLFFLYRLGIFIFLGEQNSCACIAQLLLATLKVARGGKTASRTKFWVRNFVEKSVRVGLSQTMASS